MTINISGKNQHEEQVNPIWAWVSQLAYRARDIALAFIGLLILAPFFALFALLIKRDSPGPVFYWGPRVGKNGKLFEILKFRTMYEQPESYQGPQITAKGDPRVTPVGQWLRNTKINELPQLWNVLIGEMSLIGPRPEVPEVVENWPKEIRQIILSVRPGVTSPASVIYRDEEELLPLGDEMQTYLDSVAPRKMYLDRIYVNNRSFWMDLDVLFWTLLVLTPRLGEYKLPEEQLLWGPIARLFKRYINWFSIDAITAFLAFGISSVFLRVFFGPLDVGWPRLVVISLGFALLFSIVGAFLGIQRVYWSKSSGLDAVYMIPPVGLSMVIALVANTVIDICPVRLLILGSASVLVGFVFVRYRTRIITGLASRLLSRWRVPAIARERVLIVGGGEAGQSAAWMMQNNGSGSAFHVVGFIDDDIYKDRLRIQGIDVLGRRDDIPKLVEMHDVGIIVFAIHELTTRERQKIIDICNQTPARVVMMPDFMGRLNTVASIISNIQAVEKCLHSNGMGKQSKLETI
ncbi:MAG: sugar transferase [Anaerolineales bacterium]|nr:sugar transferase [Anaerolineales bacterium]